MRGTTEVSDEASVMGSMADEDAAALHGPIRRNLHLIAIVVAALVLGPALTRSLRSYRAVVLEVNVSNGESLLAFADNKPPAWMDVVHAKPGEIVEKELFTWSPEVSRVVDTDSAILGLYRRYVSVWSGVVRHIERPLTHSGAAIAIIDPDGHPGNSHGLSLDESGALRLPIWDDALAAEIAVGRRVQKVQGTWGPMVVAPPGGAE